ncbi:MAG: hypothetical protein ACE5JE_07555 [Thermoplasmata archaeon]
MNPSDMDSVKRTVADLTAQLKRIQEAVEEGAKEEAAPAGAPEPSLPLPPPRAPRGGPVLNVQSQGESVRAFIAIFVVSFGLGAIVFAWFWVGIDDAVRLAAILLGVIASVIGFYFGQRGATRAQTQATFAMRGWQSAEARARELEDWIRRRGKSGGGRPGE